MGPLQVYILLHIMVLKLDGNFENTLSTQVNGSCSIVLTAVGISEDLVKNYRHACHLPWFCLKKSSDNPCLKVLDFSQIFVADAPALGRT